MASEAASSSAPAVVVSPKNATTILKPLIDPPTSIYCLHCRAHKPVKDVKLESTVFESRKQKKPMSRCTWVGVCAECGKVVRQFAPKEAIEVPEKKEEVKKL